MLDGYLDNICGVIKTKNPSLLLQMSKIKKNVFKWYDKVSWCVLICKGTDGCSASIKKYHERPSSYLLWRIASLMRLISFLPLYSPCLRLTFLTTLGQPASSFIFLYSYLSFSSLWMFSSALSRFSWSFWFWNCSSWRRPSSLLAFFSSYSFYCIATEIHFFIWD